MAYRQNDSQRRNDTVRFDLLERIGVLSKKDNGWTREVNIVSWNNGAAKVDIREWDPDHKRMTKGVTLFEEEAEALTKVLARRYGLRLADREPVNRQFMIDNDERDYFGGGNPPGAASTALSREADAESSEDTDRRFSEDAAERPPVSDLMQADTAAACVAEGSPYMN